jgi:glucosyl-3-phosphoglycerate synthase
MADFQQDGTLLTLHRLGVADLPLLEQELAGFARELPPALVLPCLDSDLAAPTFAAMLDELSGARYLSLVVLSLGKAGRKEVAKARKLLEVLPQPSLILHNEGRNLLHLLREMEGRGLRLGPEGKGRAVWLALGLVMAQSTAQSAAQSGARVVAVQDCDVVSYDRQMLARLLYPLLHPNLRCQFSKGYYARVNQRLFGRVTRLFVGPLIQALTDVLGPLPFLRFLAAFRYPLAGEFALSLDLARRLRFPGDWGLEMGLLAELWQRANPRRLCQVDLADSYDHKHQALSHDDPHKGLARMSQEIGRTLLTALAVQGVDLSAGAARALLMAYAARGEDCVEFYAAEAAINGLVFDAAEERLAVETFARSLTRAVEQFSANPRGQEPGDSWSQAAWTVPEFLPRLGQAAALDIA